MRLIDADALKANCDITIGDTTIGRRDYVMFHEIDSAPSIDIVRCKDCKHRHTVDCFRAYLEYDIQEWIVDSGDDNDFCSYGEREDE